MQAEILRMLASGGGAIVNAASILGLVAARNAVAYCAAKRGIVGLTKAAALDYADAGLPMNAACPDFILDGMIDRGVESGF
jgi:NAD(P)-dependent dehydrogenase (short-subunit alcohol dehydrogenase family)